MSGTINTWKYIYQDEETILFEPDALHLIAGRLFITTHDIVHGTMNMAMMRNIVLFLALLASASRLEAIELKQYSGPGITVRYEPPLENAAAALASAYPAIKADVEGKLGWRIGFVPSVVLVRRHSVFREASGNDFVTAFAVPGRDFIAIDYSRMGNTPFELRNTLAHELCHLLLHRNIEGPLLPRWLDEGVAQWTSGVTDILEPGEGDILKQAVISNSLLQLRDISERFPEQSGALHLAYAESRSFVEFIAHEYGTGKLLAVLDGLHRKKTIEQALAENLPAGLISLEEDWKKSLSAKYSWQTYLADHIYWILFFLASLVTICGYLRLRGRIKNYRDEDEAPSSGEKNP